MNSAIQTGREAFFFGELSQYRVRLGLSKAALAQVLGVTIPTLYRWESHGMLAKLNDRNAEMVALFCAAAEQVLDECPDFAERFMTLAHVAQQLGVTQEQALEAFRDETIPGWDYGVLGIFVQRDALSGIKSHWTPRALS
jgi:DNA-binding XRE family transcriptional regulator